VFPEREKITVSVRDCEHRLKTVSNLDEDKMISLLNFSRYYDKLELPIPRNRDKVLEDFSNAGAPLVAIERIVDSVPVSRKILLNLCINVVFVRREAVGMIR